ncbi:MAG: hypothetical protein FJZ16_08540 [Candidatus Omnitrophica bacterium]|nr:hypothetical protein [Candidatus Omnitrophota bacterium]
MPSVRWEYSNWALDISALAFGKLGQSYSLLRYRVKNLTKEVFVGKFALAIRPVQINPLWQYGGFSPINSAECFLKKGFAKVTINKERRFLLLTNPEMIATLPISEGDVIDFIREGGLPDLIRAEDKDGRVSIGVLYDLNIPAFSSKDFFVLFPMYPNSDIPKGIIHNTSAFFESQLNIEVKKWEQLLNRFIIDIPEKRLIDVVKSNIAYILINKDGPWIKPGPRNYNHSWLRDGALTSAALLRMGFKDEVRQWLDAVSSRVADNGYVPFIIYNEGNAAKFNSSGTGEGNEYDSQGEYVFTVRQYVDYTKDKEYLRLLYPKVIKALQFAKELRRQRMSPEYQSNSNKKPYYGILPQSNSHEGYYPAMHSYWDDFWVLKGFKDGIYLARLMGEKQDTEWLEKEADDFKKCLYESIKAVINRDRINYIPGCVEKGDFDATSTAIAITACDEKDSLPQPYLKNTFDRYFMEFEKRLRPGGEVIFTPYEVRSANAFIRMNEKERALTMLRYFVKDSVRPFSWNHMAEVVHAKPRMPSYIGDMPHTWVGSGYIDAVRTAFVYEADDKLILCAGIDVAWLDKGISIKNLPTAYGSINYTFRKNREKIEFSAYGKANPARGFVLVLPEDLVKYKITLNGKSLFTEKGRIDFLKLPVSIKMRKDSN